MSLTGPEHLKTRVPLLEELEKKGWKKEQIIHNPEWLVPKTPSEASKREAGHKFNGFPVDVAIFDSIENTGEWEHIQIIFETKAPDLTTGLSQLEIYMSLEPRVIVGYWTNGTEIVGLYRTPEGKFVQKNNDSIPSPNDNIIVPSVNPLMWSDLEVAQPKKLKKIFKRLLDTVVANDTKSTRRDDQLNQLCNLLLIKLESDKKGKVRSNEPLIFQVWEDEIETYNKISEFFKSLKLTNTDVFSSLVDQELYLDEQTVQMVCYELSKIKLLDTTIDVLSTAFQVFRTASLKSEEGQYFTPHPIIRSAVTLMDIDYDDKIIDPACGTGGFLLECFYQFKEKHPHLDNGEIKSWAQKHLYGVDKDQINIKLTKAMMMILGDGSAHTYVGDSLRENLWASKWPYLVPTLQNSSFTCIITNPPFGKNLKMTAKDLKNANLSIGKKHKILENGEVIIQNTYENRELGLAFMERCHNLLISGGRLGIILPETYFFSKSYEWFQSWVNERFILRGMINIPMEAFQGFCRAKTNFYVFEKV